MKQEASSEERMSAFSKGNEKQEAVNVESSEIDSIYTPLEEAKEEIWRRWNDKALKEKVKKFLREDLVLTFGSEPRAVLGRHVASPNFELLRFLDLSRKTGLAPLCPEYLDDIFRANNLDKYFLGNLCFDEEKSGRNPDFSNIKIVKYFGQAEGRKIRDLETILNENFVQFHHRLLHFLGINVEYFDFSYFFRKNGPSAKKYYTYFFSLFICHGILFESYFSEKKYEDFNKNIVLPSFERVFSIFGVKPLIVPLFIKGDEAALHWRFYDSALRSFFMKDQEFLRIYRKSKQKNGF